MTDELRPAEPPSRRAAREAGHLGEAPDLAAEVVSHIGMDAPTPEIGPVSDVTRLPGAHRGGFARLPTMPVDIPSMSAPTEPGTDAQVAQWAFPPAVPRRGFAAAALAFSILGLVVSLFVGWGFPVGIAGIVTAIIALRRPLESRGVAIWAIVLGVVSIAYSAGWLLFAASIA